MNFENWQINILFHEVVFDSELDQRQDEILIKESLSHLIQNCGFMPRIGDFVNDIEGKGEPFTVDGVVFHPRSKTIEFILSFDE